MKINKKRLTHTFMITLALLVLSGCVQSPGYLFNTFKSKDTQNSTNTNTDTNTNTNEASETLPAELAAPEEPSISADELAMMMATAKISETNVCEPEHQPELAKKPTQHQILAHQIQAHWINLICQPGGEALQFNQVHITTLETADPEFSPLFKQHIYANMITEAKKLGLYVTHKLMSEQPSILVESKINTHLNSLVLTTTALSDNKQHIISQAIATIDLTRNNGQGKTLSRPRTSKKISLKR